MSNIDLVILWVNSDVKQWQKSFIKYKRAENSKDVNDSDFNGACRYRDLGLLKYWFRSIEANCDWFNKIFLILADENQVPSWLDTDNEKLRIVYHREYIPSNLLPTFNSNTIELFIPYIKDLSEHYILFNDDMFINNEISDEFFFINDKPVLNIVEDPNKIIVSSLYLNTIKNDLDFITKYSNAHCRFFHNHLPTPEIKSFNKSILDNHYDEIYSSVAVSRFRNSKNFSRCIYDDSLKVLHDSVKESSSINSKFINLRSEVDTSLFDSYDTLCINDNGLTENFEIIKSNLINYFNTRYPDISSFEKVLVTVIIPVWNQEDLVINCLDSLPNDDLIEIIVVDDNSTDNTLKNLINYRRRKIKIFHCTENAGPGHARNIGIDYANGKYIVMIDSDDCVNTSQFRYILDNYTTKDYDVIYTLKTRPDHYLWCSKWSMQGDFLLKEFIGDERHNDKLSAEDTDFSKSLRAKNPASISLDNNWFYFYNYPRINSLAWNKTHNINSREYINNFYK